MRKILAGCVALVAVSWLAAGCSSSGSNSGSGGSTASSGGSTGNGSGGTTGNGSGGTTGGGSGGDNNCLLATTWKDNAPNTACATCEQANCCGVIAACAANGDCLKAYKCELNCYDGMGPDGGVVPGDDAGFVDDAMNTAMDKCVMECVAAASMAGQMLWDKQNECVNDLITTHCGDPAVCD